MFCSSSNIDVSNGNRCVNISKKRWDQAAAGYCVDFPNARRGSPIGHVAVPIDEIERKGGGLELTEQSVQLLQSVQSCSQGQQCAIREARHFGGTHIAVVHVAAVVQSGTTVA